MRAALRLLALLMECEGCDERDCFLDALFAAVELERLDDVRFLTVELDDLVLDEAEEDDRRLVVFEELTDERPDPADRLWLERYVLLSDAISDCF